MTKQLMDQWIEQVIQTHNHTITKEDKRNMDKQKSLKEEALESESTPRTKNIIELSQISTELKVLTETFKNKDGEEVTIKVVDVNGERYRVPQSVLNSLKVILEDNPNLKTFKVKKTGEGMDTRYTVIPLS